MENDMQSIGLGDGTQTYTRVRFEEASSKTEYGSDVQATDKRTGQPKWNVEFSAVSKETGKREYITVSMPFGGNPNEHFQESQPIWFVGLRVGASAKERPGFSWWMNADGIVPANTAATSKVA